MNKKIEAGFKRVKLFWDAYKMIIGVVALLGSLGIGGYAAYDDSEAVIEPLQAPEKSSIDSPEYALKGHTHTQPIQIIVDHAPRIKQAIDEYNKKHDPQKLGH